MTEFLALAATLLAAGAVTGLLAGLFGVGGGAISVPVFFETFRLTGIADDVAMPLAVGTSLALIVPTSLLSAREHARRGAIDGHVLRVWAAPIVIGVLLGAVLARDAPAALFQSVFAVVAGLLSARLLLGGQGWRMTERLPSAPVLAVYGGGVGLVSALMGIGGGAISTVILTLHGKPIHAAVATSAAVGALIAVPGALGYMWAGIGVPGRPALAIGYVSLLTLALCLPTVLLTTRAGVRLAHALSRKTLSRAFGLFLALVSLRFLLAAASGH